jgi:hypothetical protein
MAYRGWQHMKKWGSIPQIEDGAEGLKICYSKFQYVFTMHFYLIAKKYQQ